MSNELAVKSDFSKIEQVLLKGDLKVLNESQRIQYYNEVCSSVGLNPLTKPFDYIELSGKLVLYANKGCAEQLRNIHKLSIRITDRITIEGVYIVTAAAQDANGRVDESTGAVQIAGLKGDSLANAMMKAETKAKRRVSLSICGLNMLDDTEVETIKDAPNRVGPSQPAIGDGIRKFNPDEFPDGKYARKRFHELPLPELRAEFDHRESIAESAEDFELLSRLEQFIETASNYPEEPEDSNESVQLKPTCCNKKLALSKKGVYYCPDFSNKDVQHIKPVPKAAYEALL